MSRRALNMANDDPDSVNNTYDNTTYHTLVLMLEVALSQQTLAMPPTHM
jgi:hypothetical protein